MGAKTGIEWTGTLDPQTGRMMPGSTWNPIKARRKDNGKVGFHCERVSDACKHCYAATFNKRGLSPAGTGLDYTVPNRDNVEIFFDDKSLQQVLSWRRGRKIFCCSMTDLFGEFVPDSMIDRVFAAAALRPQHTFLVLTKRPERMLAWFDLPYDNREHAVGAVMREMSHGTDPGLPEWPLKNVWLGVTVEDQQQVEKRIPWLLSVPAVQHFVSAEPLLGPLDLFDYLGTHCQAAPGISWVIAGGESGPGSRPAHPDWFRSLQQQCQSFGVPYFFKQHGEFLGPRQDGNPDLDTPQILNASDDFLRVGKKKAGNLLDGRRYQEFPLSNSP